MWPHHFIACTQQLTFKNNHNLPEKLCLYTNLWSNLAQDTKGNAKTLKWLLACLFKNLIFFTCYSANSFGVNFSVSLEIIRYYNNAYYAKVGGITTIEMNFLEVDFLFGLGFHLNVTPGTFQAYCAHLQSEMLLMQPLNFADSFLSLGKSLNKAHLCYNEDESSSHQKQQQLAVWFLALPQCM